MRVVASLLFALSILSSAASAPAQGATDLSACQAIDGAAERLDCYDGLAAMTAMAADGAARADEGGWVREEWPSRLNPVWTDYEAWTAALNPVPGAGGIPVYPVLTLRCEQGETRVFFNFGRVMAGDSVMVHYRLGAGEIQPGELIPAPDGRRFGLWTSARSVRFIRALARSARLRIQVPVDGAEPLTAAFELGGLAAAAAPLGEACGWE
ncbi:MAG: hypothetical protein IMF05_10655 [Proteobacteria bacterium]|nr:hypothetical protein [Pseudomonadota bacterium]